jgi:hypothetical protein
MKASETKLTPGDDRLRPTRRPGKSGMTLLEVTVVILVLLGLITILFIGAQAWKRGSDRAICIINIQNVQKGVRSYTNLYGFNAGDNVPGLQSEVIGFGRFVETTPSCPGGGTYAFGQTYGADTIPPYGTLYMECSLAATNQHEPDDFTDW